MSRIFRRFLGGGGERLGAPVVSNPIDYTMLHVGDPHFIRLPNDDLNQNFQILTRVPDDEYRARFQKEVEDARYVIEGQRIFVMDRTTNGDLFCKGPIDTWSGIVSDETGIVWERTGDELLWVAREVDSWPDPSGESGPPRLREVGVPDRPIKQRNPYAPPPRK